MGFFMQQTAPVSTIDMESDLDLSDEDLTFVGDEVQSLGFLQGLDASLLRP